MVARDRISEFLEACKALHIKGVEDLVSCLYLGLCYYLEITSKMVWTHNYSV